MSPLRQALAGYLTTRRSLGYKLTRAEKLLGQLITYLEDAGAATVTTEHVLAWATAPGGEPRWHADRLTVARRFAIYLQAIDPAAEIPPAGLIPSRPCRATPYLYSDADISADRRRGQLAVPAAGRDLPDAHRAARRHRPADQRSDPPRPGRS